MARFRQTDMWVFHGPRGGRLKPDTVLQSLKNMVIKPLAPRFPSPAGGKGFADGTIHSFRHYFASMCANSQSMTERMTMEWLGHADSEMVRHYYHLTSEQAQAGMAALDPLGTAGKQPAGDNRAAKKKGGRPPSGKSVA